MLLAYADIFAIAVLAHTHTTAVLLWSFSAGFGVLNFGKTCC